MSGDGEVAIVTGASRGIGARIARALGADGFRVLVHYNDRADAARRVAQEIEGAGGEALVVRADVADPAAVTSVFDAAVATWGGVDVVVSSAGIMPLTPIAELSDNIVDRTIAVNLKGTINVCREAARRIRNGGRIINLSSSVIGMRLPTYGLYIATKAAVEGLTQVLAQEMRGRNVRVNAIAPGPTATELFLSGKSEELIDRLAKLNPLERLAHPEDIAGVASFLASKQGVWINGQVLRVNGGMC